MPQIVLPALFSAGTQALAAGSFAGFWGTFFLDAALGGALYALSPHPKPADAGPQTLSFRSSNATRKLVYGQPRVGGVLTFVESTNSNQYLHSVLTIAAHEVDSFVTYYLDDEALTISGNDVTSPVKYAGIVKVYPVTVGASTNTPASLIADTAWTTASVETDQAYTYMRFAFNRDAFPSGMPNISVVMKGRKVYDPRSATTAYSNNPALCIRDYLMDTRYGMGFTATEIDDVSFSSAANVCDEAVTLAAGGTEARYTLDGVVDTGITPRENIKRMLTAMVGSIYESNGKIKIRAGAYVTPTITLDEDDLAGPIKLITAVTAANSFNAVRGQFVGPESDYQPTDYTPVTSSTFETEDGGFRKYKDINLPFTNKSSRAQRIAKIFLYQNRQEIFYQAKFKLTAFKFDPGDTVMLNNARYGFSGKAFVVKKIKPIITANEVVVECVLRETNSGVYSWSAEETAFAQDNTTLPDASTVATPTGLSLTTGTTINADGVAVPRIIATWTSVGTGFVSGYELQYKLATDADYTSIDGTTGRAVIQPVISGASYDVRVRAINVFGVRSSWATASVSGTGDTTAPAAPTGIGATAGNKQVALTWTNPSDSDFDHVDIWRNTTNSSATATKIGDNKGTSFIDKGLANGTAYYYWFKSADLTGNLSSFTTSVTATTAPLNETDLTVSSLSAVTGTIGTFRSASTGERLEITDAVLRVYDASNVLRVKLGNLA